MTAAPYLYDQVRLDDSTQGVVKYIGEVKGKNGTVFGLEMLPYYGGHDTADTNGTIGDQVYFTCTDGEELGRWVTEDDIEEVLDDTNHDLELFGDAPKFTVGDRCFIPKKNCNAMVHYVGIPKFARDPKIFIGLELDEPVGNCNGTLAGCTYFECDDKYGLYQVPKNVTLAQEEVNVDIDEVDYDKYAQEEKEKAEQQQIDREQREQREAEQRERERKYKEQQEEEEAKRKALEEQQRRIQMEADTREQRQRAMSLEAREKRAQAAAADQERQAQLRRIQQEKERERQREEEERARAREREAQRAKAAAAQQNNDDYKAFEAVDYGGLLAPKLEPRTVRDGNVETIYPTYMTNFCVKARTHHKLKNYKTINYSSRKYQMDDQVIQNKMEELHKAHVADRGHFILDGNKAFCYTLVNKPHEWRAVTRVNTDNIEEAKACLEFIEKNTQKAVADVDRIQKFNWDKNFQALVSAIRKANQ